MVTEKDRYAGFPSAVVYDSPNEGKKPQQQLLWGDWMQLKEGVQENWQEVDPRGPSGWMLKEDIKKNKLLELTFVDVGQGDGCLIITPDDDKIIIDAGKEDNMYRFLYWKFGKFKKDFVFQSAIITHPDADHYGGFTKFFENPNIKFETVYHNGICEREVTKGKKILGKIEGKGKEKFLVDLIQDKNDLVALSGGKEYYKMLKKVLDSGRVGDIRWLTAGDKYLPGYEANKPLSIQVLGPVSEPDDEKRPRLRYFDNDSKTKNGHSIVLKIKYNNVKIFIGGDLNSESENFLLSHYTGISSPPVKSDKAKFITLARRVFKCDIYKSCHHGSSDFTSDILAAVEPLATVISSGDDEPYSHPRADTLGTLGKFSRGDRPLIFSTELARSAKEKIKNSDQMQKELEKWMEKSEMTQEQKDKAREERRKIYKKIGRSIDVYGAISLRTDGNDVVVAQRIERPSGKSKQWDIYPLRKQKNGDFKYESEYIQV